MSRRPTHAEALPLVHHQQGLNQRGDDLLIGNVFDTLRVELLDELVARGGHHGEVVRDDQGCEYGSAPWRSLLMLCSRRKKKGVGAVDSV